MDLRHLLVLVPIAAGAQVAAQNEKPATAAPPAAAAPAAGATAGQDPDRSRKTPAERITELTSEKERLEREIAFVRERVKSSRELLVRKFGERTLTVRSIDAGTTVAAPVAINPVQRHARLMTEEERKKVAEGVLMTVNGREVGKADLDRMLEYLSGFPGSGDEAGRLQRAMLETIRIESTHATFPEGAAEAQQQIALALQDLRGGKPFGEVAKVYSRGPLQEDGRIKVTRNCPFGLPVEMAVFATAEGKLTEPVRGYTGFVLVQVDKITKGQNQDNTPNPDLDIIDGHMILVPFHPDPAELDAARNRSILGPVDIVVRDDSVMEQLPSLYRPLPAQKDVDVVGGKGAEAPKVDPDRKD